MALLLQGEEAQEFSSEKYVDCYCRVRRHRSMVWYGHSVIIIVQRKGKKLNHALLECKMKQYAEICRLLSLS